MCCSGAANGFENDAKADDTAVKSFTVKHKRQILKPNVFSERTASRSERWGVGSTNCTRRLWCSVGKLHWPPFAVKGSILDRCERPVGMCCGCCVCTGRVCVCVEEKTGSRRGGLPQNTEQVGLWLELLRPSWYADVSFDCFIKKKKKTQR